MNIVNISYILSSEIFHNIQYLQCFIRRVGSNISCLFAEPYENNGHERAVSVLRPQTQTRHVH